MSKVKIAIRDPQCNIAATVDAWPLKDFPEFAVHKHHKLDGLWTVSHIETGSALLEWPLDDKNLAEGTATKILRAKDLSAIANAVARMKRKIRRAEKAAK